MHHQKKCFATRHHPLTVVEARLAWTLPSDVRGCWFTAKGEGRNRTAVGSSLSYELYFLTTIPVELPEWRLLDGDGFGEVAGFVNVATAGDGDVVGEELQGHDGEDGVNGFEGFGDVKHVVGNLGDLVVAFGGDGDDGAFAGADHGEVGHGFVVHGVLGDKEDGGGFGVDEGDGAVFHLGGGIALGVDVGDFLELE